jgi:glycosyltransferase involved in cell wall biosynthesis
VLRRLPEEMDESDPGPQPISAILHRLMGHFGQNLQICADTKPLAELWSKLLGVPIQTVPLPVTVPVGQARPASVPPNLVFPGGGRTEKGYCLLPAIVVALKDQARFTIHSGRIDRKSAPAIQRAHRALTAQIGPRVRVIEGALEPDDYLTLLEDADLMLLPYDPRAYGPRSSGILAEARALAIPAVVPRGCWMEQVAGPAQPLAFDFPDGFAASVANALAQLAPLTAAMREVAPAWRAIHNPGALLDVLLGIRPGL